MTIMWSSVLPLAVWSSPKCIGREFDKAFAVGMANDYRKPSLYSRKLQTKRKTPT